MDDYAEGSESLDLWNEFLAQLQKGEDCDFDGLMEANPEHAESLQRFKGEWERVDELFRELGYVPSVAQAIEGEFGEGAVVGGVDEGGAAEALVKGRRFGTQISGPRLRLGELIEEGGQGAVYEAWDESLGRKVALKLVHVSRGELVETAPRVLRRFQLEAQLMAELAHPGVVPIYDIGLDEFGVPYFTMKRVQGRTLADVIRLARENREQWSVERFLRVLIRVVETLGYAHSRGVLHRDIKPKNILVGDFGEVFVVDWGLAGARALEGAVEYSRELKAAADHTASEDAASLDLLSVDRFVVGTPSYMSPEQAGIGEGGVGPASDIYGVGAIIYELLNGFAPYAEPGRSGAAIAVLDRLRVEKPSAVRTEQNHALAAICNKAMEREPASRYPDAAALERELQAFLSGDEVLAAPETGLSSVRRSFAANRRSIVPLLVAGVLIVASILMLSRVYRDGARREAGLTADIEGMQSNVAGLEAQISQLEGEAVRNEGVVEREAEKSKQVVELLGNIFAAPTPELRRGRETTAFDVLEQSRVQLRFSGIEDAGVLATLKSAVAEAYLAIGSRSEAGYLVDEVAQMDEADLPAHHAARLVAKRVRAVLAVGANDLDEAKLLFEECWAGNREVHGEASREALRAELELVDFGINQLGGVGGDGLIELKRVRDAQIKSLGRWDEDVFATKLAIGNYHAGELDLAKAEELLREGLEECRREFPEADPTRLAFMNSLGLVYVNGGRIADAEALFATMVAEAIKVYGEESGMVAHYKFVAAAVPFYRQDYEAAEKLLVECVRDLERSLGPGNDYTLRARYYLAGTYAKLKRVEEAIVEAEEVLFQQLEQFGDEGACRGFDAI